MRARGQRRWAEGTRTGNFSGGRETVQRAGKVNEGRQDRQEEEGTRTGGVEYRAQGREVHGRTEGHVRSIEGT